MVAMFSSFQTLKFCKDLGRFTGLRAICVLGGDSMEKQFALMHENPVKLNYYFQLHYKIISLLKVFSIMSN